MPATGLPAAAATLLCVLALPLVIVLGSVRFAFSWQPVYTYAVTAYHPEVTTGIPGPQLISATRAIRNYFSNRVPDLDVTVTGASGESERLFDQREIAHMRDVKMLVQRLYLLLNMAAGAFLLGVLVLTRSGRGASRRLALAVLLGSLLTGVLLLVFGVAAAAGFDRLFLEFHLLSFSNTYWELDPSRDHLIQIFPQGYWLDVTMFVTVVALAVSALLAGATAVYLLLTHTRDQSPARS